MAIGILHSILNFEHSRNQRQCSEFSSPIDFNMGVCISICLIWVHVCPGQDVKLHPRGTLRQGAAPRKPPVPGLR